MQRPLGRKPLGTHIACLLIVAMGLLAVSCRSVPPSPPPTPTPMPTPAIQPVLPQAEPAAFVPYPWNELSEHKDDGDLGAFKAALKQSLEWANRQSPTRVFTLQPGVTYTAGDLQKSLQASFESVAAVELNAGQSAQTGQAGQNAQAQPNATVDLPGLLSKHFDLYKSSGKDEGKTLFTGYYVPTVEGSLVANPAYPVPVYGIPNSLVIVSLGEFNETLKGKTIRGRIDGKKLVPFWDRKAIREGRTLERDATPIAWVKDEFDLFVIEIQGSGILVDPTGQRRVIGFAEQNGHSYKPVGRLLLDENKVSKEKMSMQAIRAYVRANPADLGRLVNYNPSFVFFRLLDKNQALGNLNVPLTAGRSVATDQKVFPPALPLFVRLEKPKLEADGTVGSSGEINRLVFNQDTGGAIKGIGRMDFFWGEGPSAEELAGVTKHPGQVFVFVPKQASELRANKALGDNTLSSVH